MKTNTQNTRESQSVLSRLFETVPETPTAKLGHYDPSIQTWSHRNAILMSPVKHNQEE